MTTQYRYQRRQRGAATLLFILLTSMGLLAAATGALFIVKNSQGLQYAEHTVTQAQVNAWTGVKVISAAIATLSSTPTLTAGGAVTFAGLPSGISATYVGTQNGFLVFNVTGTSSGATSTLHVAYQVPTTGGSGGGPATSIGFGEILAGNTTLSGGTHYTGGGAANLYVVGGTLDLSGSVSGLNSVCATGSITISSAVAVNNLCTLGSLSLSGSAIVGTAATASTSVTSVAGTISTSGGSGIYGTINTNSSLTLNSTIPAYAVNATGNVTVSSIVTTSVNTQGNINWTSSSNTVQALNANGTVTYDGSGTSTTTAITAIGNVSLIDAGSVTTDGNTYLAGSSTHGIHGNLNGVGTLSGASWGSSGGNVVTSGTIGGPITTPVPPTVHVTVTPGHTVAISPVVIPTITFTQTPLTIDAYALKAQANFAFTGVDSNGNPIVTVSNVNGIANGTYFVSAYSSANQNANYVCASVSGTHCTSAALARICGVSGNTQQSCFSYNSGGSDGGSWTLKGQMLPSVAWFQGDFTSNPTAVIGTVIATGNITMPNDIYSPNFVGAATTCSGAAYTPPAASGGPSIPALSTFLLSATNYATQLCSGSPLALTGATLGNDSLIAGGYQGTVFSGGSVTLSGGAISLGVVLAGAFINTSGSSYVAGSLYSANEGNSASGQNVESGSSSINVTGASSSYNGYVPSCLSNCASSSSSSADNVVWVSPI